MNVEAEINKLKTAIDDIFSLIIAVSNLNNWDGVTDTAIKLKFKFKEDKKPFEIDSLGDYITRDGKKVKVVHISDDPPYKEAPVFAVHFYKYHERIMYHDTCGRCNPYVENPEDIVAKWED